MSEKKFWDNFYRKHNKQAFEWLIDYNDLATFLDLNSQRANLTSMLDVGCGTSLFSHNLQKSLSLKSFLICADFSYEALDLLKAQQTESSLKRGTFSADFVQCNCKHLPFRDDFFELIIDKGYSDSLLKSTSPDGIKNTVIAMQQIRDKLAITISDTERRAASNKPVLLQLTDETPELRTSLFDQLDHSDCFTLSYRFKEMELDDSRVYYAYFVYKEEPGLLHFFFQNSLLVQYI